MSSSDIPWCSCRLVKCLTVTGCRAGHISIEAEGPALELLLVRDLRCTPTHARAAPAAGSPAPSTAGPSEHGRKHAAAVAALHAQATPAARGREPGVAAGSEHGGRQAGAAAGLHAGDPHPGAAAGEPHGVPGGLVLSWQAPEHCTRCEVWARRDPGPPDLPATAAADGGQHCPDALGSSPASRAAPMQHQDRMAHAGGEGSPCLTECERSDRLHAYRAHEQGPGEHEQPNRPDAGDSLAGETRPGAYDSASCGGWTWLGTAHAQRFWVAWPLLDLGDRGVELAVQARNGAGCALPLSACPRVRASGA